MARRAVLTVGLVMVGVALVAGCSGEEPDASTRTATPSRTSTTTTTAADADHPRGVIAIGHSSLTGVSAHPDRPQEDAPESSWATGTDPAVDSVYLRLVKARPETLGAVANAAKDGAKAATLQDQAEDALDQVPFPALAIVQTIDNDIRCDGSDPGHRAEFRASVRAAIGAVHQASPRTTILVVSNYGSPAGFAKALSGDPVAVSGLAGSDPCALFTTDGKINAKGVATLTAIIDGYEVEQFRACKEVPGCHGDDGALSTFTERLDQLSSDRQHLLDTGHAELATLIWPTVEKVLGLG